MSPRERVLKAFAHEEPDRVPLWLGPSPEFWAKLKCYTGIGDDEALRIRIGDDFRRVFARDAGAEPKLSAGATYCSVFGVERHGYGYGQPLTAPPLAAATVERIHDYPWPDPGRMDVSGVRREAAAWHGEYAVLGGDWSPFWHDAIDLLGMETLYFRMYDDPEAVEAVFEHVVDYYAAVSERILEAAADVIDIFFIGNDFGGQRGPLLGPGQFERFIVPHLTRLIGLGHRYGLKVQLHCCGGIRPLMPMLINAGLDAVHALQPCCQGMDLRALKADFGNRIVLNGAVDSRSVLINGTSESVRRATREVLEIMMPGGGYVAGASHDYVLEETPAENVLAMFDAVRESGRYS